MLQTELVTQLREIEDPKTKVNLSKHFSSKIFCLNYGKR